MEIEDEKQNKETDIKAENARLCKKLEESRTAEMETILIIKQNSSNPLLDAGL